MVLAGHGSRPLEIMKVSVPRAARAVLRQHGEPMRVTDILSALREGGRTDIAFRRLNGALYREFQKGRLTHPETGMYAYLDRAALLGTGLIGPAGSSN
jgi:hypothetical protein